jgi:hypothetical protein
MQAHIDKVHNENHLFLSNTGIQNSKCRRVKYNILALILYQPGGQIMPTLYWCPHQVLKATGAPVVAKKHTILVYPFNCCENVFLVAKM